MNKLLIAPGVAVIGLALMVAGLVTTYVALGQDVSPEATDEVVAPTFTPTALMEADKTTNRSAVRQDGNHSGQREAQASDAHSNQSGDGGQGRGQATKSDKNNEQPEPAQDSATPSSVPEAQTDASEASLGNGDQAGHGQGRDGAPGQNKAESGKGNATGESPAASNGAEHANHADGAPPAAGQQPAEVPAAEGVPPEPPGPVPVAEPEPAATPIVAEITPSLVSGRVDSRARVSVSLTLPTGQIISQAADEQGAFQFEVTEPGEYRLVASAPGALSRQMIFNLDAGQQVELPLTSLSPGDVNQDSRIDMSDIVLVAANYDGPAQVAQADLNGDSWIDLSDLALIGAKFGLTGPLPWDAPSP